MYMTNNDRRGTDHRINPFTVFETELSQIKRLSIRLYGSLGIVTDSNC